MGKRRRALVVVLSLALVASIGVVASVPLGGTGSTVSVGAHRSLLSRIWDAARELVGGKDKPDARGKMVQGAKWSPPGRSGTAVAKAKPKPPGKRVTELAAARTATRTVFQLDDGRVQAEVSSVPVRYRDSSGTWRDIDAKVAPITGDPNGFSYGNDGTGFATRFGSRSDALVKVQLADRSVTIGVPGAVRQIAPKVKDSTVTYAGVWDGADLVYDVTPTGLKESIVLSKTPPADTSFAFTVQTAGVDTRTSPDGSIAFFATGTGPTATPVFTVPKPFMTDARKDAAAPQAHAYSDRVTMTATGQGATTTVALTPDHAWLAAKGRTYPVVVDPTIAVQPDVNTSKDAMIVSYNGTSNYGTDPRLGVGVDTKGKIRSLVQFNLAGVVPAGTPVDSANLSLYWDNTVLTGSTSNPVALEARAVTQDWATSTVTWNSINTAMGDVAGTATYSATQGNTWTSFPVTGVVRDWVAGTRPNYGFMLKAATETQTTGGPFFWAGEFPVAAAGDWPTYTTRTAPKLTLTFGLPAVTLDDPQTVASAPRRPTPARRSPSTGTPPASRSTTRPSRTATGSTTTTTWISP